MATSTETFLYFSRFPIELRLKIWTLALPGPRIIKPVWNHLRVKWEFNSEIPAVLQACSESRIELWKESGLLHLYIKDIRPFYFRYKLDTIYLRHPSLFIIPYNKL